MTNTDCLIKSLELAIKSGLPHLDFMVGKYTGNGPSVVAALRRRGFKVERNRAQASYRLHDKPAA